MYYDTVLTYDIITISFIINWRDILCMHVVYDTRYDTFVVGSLS
jgi:hypothetical protein